MEIITLLALRYINMNFSYILGFFYTVGSFTPVEITYVNVQVPATGTDNFMIATGK